MFSILSLNINDLGGINHHLMECKKRNWKGQEIIDWDFWKEFVEKTSIYLAILNYIRKVNPDVVIFQEFEVNNSEEPKKFIEKLNKYGYRMINNIPHYKASITVVFSKSLFPLIRNPNSLNGRSHAFRVGDIVLLGMHVPPKGNDRIEYFWNEIDDFYRIYCDEKILLLGDFNTINPRNMERYKQLIDAGAVDVWLDKGYAGSVVTCGNIRMDIAIASPQLLPFVADITICPSLFYKGITDHAALIIDIEM